MNRKFNYDITFSNGVVVTVELTNKHPVTLWVTLPTGEKVEFSHEPNRTPKERKVDLGGLTKKKSSGTGTRKDGSTGPLDYLTVPDPSASPAALTMKFGDPEDPFM